MKLIFIIFGALSLVQAQESSTVTSITTSTAQTTTEDPINYIHMILDQGHCLTRNDIVYSDNRCFHWRVRNDGNMVVYRVRDNAIIWATNTTGTNAEKICMQTDGNFVLYGPHNNNVWDLGAVWIALHVFNVFNRPEYAVLENNGLLLLKKYKGTIKWSSEVVAQC